MTAFRGQEFFTDPITPDQFHDSRGVNLNSGEKRLMLAILEDAIDCVLSGNKTFSGQARKEALEWIESRDTTRLFSFENVCRELGFNAGRLRDGILRQRERKRISIIPERTGEIVRTWCATCYAIVWAELMEAGESRYYECLPWKHVIKKLRRAHRKK